MPMFTFGEWLPDLGPVELPGLIDVSDVYPIANGWKIFPPTSPVQYGPALSGLVRGASTGRLQNSVTFLVAGTDDTLYISTDGGANFTSTGGFNVPAEGRWSFGMYDTNVYAVNGNDIPQYIDLSVGVPAWAANSLDMSNARVGVIAEQRGFYILGDLDGRGANAGAIGRLEGGVHWSAAGEPLSWPVVGTQAARDVLSDFQPLPGPGGPVMAIVPTSEFIAVLRQRQTWRMDFVGGTEIFRFRMIDSRRGCNVRDGAVAVGSRVYFPSDAGFLMFDGANLHSVGHQKIDRTWKETMVEKGENIVSAAHAPAFKMVLWTHPTESASLFDEVYGYQYELGQWTKLRRVGSWLFSVSASEAGRLDPDPLGSEDMDNVAELGLVNLDTLGLGTFGNEALALFDDRNFLRLISDSAFFVGPPSEIITGDYRSQDDRRMVLKSVRPHVSRYAVAADVDDPLVQVYMSARNQSRADVVFDSNYKRIRSTGDIAYRKKGRYFRTKWELYPAVDEIQGFEAIWKPGANR